MKAYYTTHPHPYLRQKPPSDADHAELMRLLLNSSEVFDVKAFGARGDGITDDTLAIETAILAADDAGGGRVVIPYGVYSVGSMGLSNISNVEIVGLGLPKLRSDNPGDTDPDRSVLNFYTGCTDIVVDGLEIDGNYSAHSGLPAATNNHCIAIGFSDWQSDTITCKRFRIRNCYLHDSGWQKAGIDKFGDNLYIASGEDIWVTNNFFEDAGRWHIAVTLGRRVHIEGNHFHQDATNATHGLGTLDFEYGTKTTTGGDHIIRGNVSLGHPRMQFSGNSGQTNILIQGNILDAEDRDGTRSAGAPAANQGLVIQDCDNVSIQDNIILNTDNNGCIRIDPENRSPTGYHIANNYCDSDTHGIVFSAGTASDITITGNWCRANTGAFNGLYALNTSLSDMRITNNYFESVASWPARISATGVSCIANRFVSGTTVDVEFHCSENSMFALNSYEQDYRFTTVSGSTGCVIALNKGGYSGSSTAIESLEGTATFFPTEDHYAPDAGTGIVTLADNATPSIKGGDRFLTGGTTTITDFDDGETGQIIHILSEHAITITDGTNIFLNGSVNFTMANTDTLTLIQKSDGKWYELSRSVN